jgi:hypothetical protein
MDDLPPADLSTLDGMCSYLGLSLGEPALLAMVREAQTRRQDLASVLDRIFRGRHNTERYPRPESAASFIHLITELWDREAADSRIDTPQLFAVRELALKLVDIELATLRELDRRGMHPSNLPQDALMEFGQLTALIANVVILIKQDEGSDVAELESMVESISLMEPIMHDLAARLRGDE